MTGSTGQGDYIGLQPPAQTVGLNTEVTRETSAKTVTAPYRSITITTISADVTVDGTPFPANFPWSIDSSRNQEYKDDKVITGSEYILTVVTEV